MGNVFYGSKNGLINRFCCLFSYYSLANLIINIVLFIIGLITINKFTSLNRYFVTPSSLENYNKSIFEALTLAVVVSITVFLVNEIKETNNKNAYTENFFRTIFKSKFKTDSRFKNAFFILVPVLTIVVFVLLKYGENLSDPKTMNTLFGAAYTLCIIVLFSIIEIVIYYLKINHKKIEISRNLHGLIPSKYTVNYIENSKQANDVIDVIKLADNIDTVKNSIYILLDIFSEYDYFNKLEIYESISERICDDVVEFCTDKKYGNSDLEITFIINSVISDIINDITDKDSKNNRILLSFFLFSKYFCSVKFENMNTLSKNSQNVFSNLLPYIFLVYSDELKNKGILMKEYRELFVKNKLTFIEEEKRKELYSLVTNIIEYKSVIGEIKVDSYFMFKKIGNRGLYSLYVQDYIIFNDLI